MKAEFVHLHVHSEYSLLDGCAGIRDLPAMAARLGMRAIALTDHGVLHGAVQFCRAAEEAGVKPILGCELYVVDKLDPGARPGRPSYYHLTVLVENETGYRNLAQLSSKGFLEGFYYRPRVSKEQLKAHKDGLIVLSGCLAAEVPALLAEGRFEEARAAALWYRECFGPNRYFLELMDHGLPEQPRVNEGLFRLHRELGLALVATNDVHYLHREDAGAQDTLLCIQTGKKRHDPDRLRFDTEEFYLKSPGEMASLFQELPESLANTLEIAERCTFVLREAAKVLPAFPERDDARSSDERLRDRVLAGAKARYGDPLPRRALERIEHELRVIAKTGYADYFLIVWDLIRFARERGIAVGPGRGSSASSIVAYSLEITDIDPLEHGLLFERFLNPERVSMPDIDIDLCMERRGEVIAYARERYGEDRVAHIGTFGTLAARAAIRDVGRVLDLPYAEVDRIAKLIPPGPGVTLNDAAAGSEELRAAIDSDPQHRSLWETGLKIEGRPRHLSVHAAGIVIAPEPLAASVPLCRTSDGAVVTQFTGEDLEALGYLKMDLLGLRTLTVIDKARRLVEQTRGITLDLRSLKGDDPEVYAALSRGETQGVFQLETGMFQQLLREVRPESFDDLVAILALGRPGPMARLDDYLRIRRGKAEPQYPHPAMKSILDETCGVMLYQEQVMRIATELAGYSAGEADLLRRAMGKKLPEIMEKERERFVRSAAARGMDEAAAARVFEDVARFAEYGFPKSHSAAYARVAYVTAYLKVHFPAEYLAAQMSSVRTAGSTIGRYLEECRRLGIPVKGPDVNAGDIDFTVSDGAIVYGLAAVKNVGRALAGQIVSGREEGPYRSLEDFCARLSGGALNRKALESLARVGAFECLGITRKEALARLEAALRRRDLAGRLSGQESLFAEKASPAAQERQVTEASPGATDFSLEEKLLDEIELLGTYVSANPADPFREVLEAFRLQEDAAARGHGTIGGVVVSVQETAARTGGRMAFATVEDIEGNRCEVVVFPNLYRQVGPLAPGAVVVARGRVESEDEQLKLLADSLRMLQGEPVVVGVDSPERLEALRRAIGGGQGGRPVILRIESRRHTVRLLLPPKWWIEDDAALARL